jgi:hypothetical protein
MTESSNASSEQYPRSVDDAVQFVLSRMTEEAKAYLRGFEGDEIDLHLELAKDITSGMNVRAMLGLWGHNTELLAQLPPAFRHPDSASSFFVVECWRRLTGRSM